MQITAYSPTVGLESDFENRLCDSWFPHSPAPFSTLPSDDSYCKQEEFRTRMNDDDAPEQRQEVWAENENDCLMSRKRDRRILDPPGWKQFQFC